MYCKILVVLIEIIWDIRKKGLYNFIHTIHGALSYYQTSLDLFIAGLSPSSCFTPFREVFTPLWGEYWFYQKCLDLGLFVSSWRFIRAIKHKNQMKNKKDGIFCYLPLFTGSWGGYYKGVNPITTPLMSSITLLG